MNKYIRLSSPRVYADPTVEVPDCLADIMDPNFIPILMVSLAPTVPEINIQTQN